MDKIKINNLEVFCNHGVFPEENTLGQKFLVSAILYTDLRAAGLSDELTMSIHYGEVCHYIKKYMESHTFKLIETVAENLAKALLLDTKYLNKIELEIKKPWAPIGLPIDYVSVNIDREWHTAYIAIGSNMGDKKAFLDQAIKELNESIESNVSSVSDYIITKPYGVTDQDDFLNGCLELKTLLTPEELLTKLNQIEQNAHRERIVHWGPRTLDLDIIFYDDMILDQSNLTIPHVDMQNRKFVLEPLSQIAGFKRHPVLQLTVNQLLKNLEQMN